ncbi:MAG: CoA transferase [Pseudomonadota bacterium]
MPYETFQAADGWINVAVANDGLWRRFCAATGRSDLVDDPRFAMAPARVQNRAILVPILQAMIAAQPRGHWVDRLEAAGVPCGAIKTVGEVCASPALAARGMLRELAHETAGALRMFDTPIRLGATPGGTDRPPPVLGQHTSEVLTTLAGLTPAEVQALIAAGAAR